MGIIFMDGEVKGPTDKTATVHFLVDSGATYSLLAKDTWQDLQLQPKRSASFTLADGTRIERHGAVTLEILGRVLNPFNRTLQPMRMMPV